MKSKKDTSSKDAEPRKDEPGSEPRKDESGDAPSPNEAVSDTAAHLARVASSRLRSLTCSRRTGCIWEKRASESLTLSSTSRCGMGLPEVTCTLFEAANPLARSTRTNESTPRAPNLRRDLRPVRRHG